VSDASKDPASDTQPDNFSVGISQKLGARAFDRRIQGQNVVFVTNKCHVPAGQGEVAPGQRHDKSDPAPN